VKTNEAAERLANGIGYAIARAPVPDKHDTAGEVAARLAPLVIESGWLDEALAAERLIGYAEAANAKNLQKLIAAERIRAVADHQAECQHRIRDHGDAVRRATVERIRNRLMPDVGVTLNPFDVIAILDEEAAR
jgi:hypothetical protein